MSGTSGTAWSPGELHQLTLIMSGVFLLIGGIIGFLSGQVIVAQSAGQGIAAGQGPRIRNVVWLTGSSFTLIFADPKKLQLPEQLAMFWPWLGYLGGALIGVAAAVGVAWISLSRSIGAFNARHPPDRQIDRHALLMEYLWHGSERYGARRKEEEARVKDLEARDQAETESKRLAERKNDDARRAEFAVLHRQANQLVVANLYATLELLRSDGGPDVDDVTATIQAIIETIRVYLIAYTDGRLAGESAIVRVSVMAFVPAAKGDEVIRADRAFVAGMPDDYHGDLVLRVPPSIAGRPIVLPVAKKKENLLPGAPETFFTLLPGVMNIRERGFPATAPAPVKAEIAAYFAQAYFKGIRSITSIAIAKGHRGVGVLNIETSADNLAGGNSDDAQAIVDRLQVPIALLSALL